MTFQSFTSPEQLFQKLLQRCFPARAREKKLSLIFEKVVKHFISGMMCLHGQEAAERRENGKRKLLHQYSCESSTLSKCGRRLVSVILFDKPRGRVGSNSVNTRMKVLITLHANRPIFQTLLMG